MFDLSWLSPEKFVFFDITADGNDDILTVKDSVFTGLINRPPFNSDKDRWQIVESNTFELPIEHITHADLDGDGLEDLILFSEASEDAFVTWMKYFEAGNGKQDRFESQHTFYYPEGDQVYSNPVFHLEDMDQDGDIDILYRRTATPILLENTDGAGNFSIRAELTDLTFTMIFMQDLNKDGLADMLIDRDGTYSIRFNDGNANFVNETSVTRKQGIAPNSTFLNDSLIVGYYIPPGQESGNYRINKLANGTLSSVTGSSVTLSEDYFFYDFNKDGIKDQVHVNFGFDSEFLEVTFFDPNNVLNSSFQHYQTQASQVSKGDIDHDGWDDIVYQYQGKFSWIENLAQDFNVAGTAFIDLNGNKQRDAGEPALANARITSPDFDFEVFTNEEGDYSITLPVGTYQMEASFFDNNIQSAEEEPKTIEIANGQQLTGVDFAFNFTGGTKNFDISLFSSITRCDNEVRFSLIYENTGDATTDGSIELNIDDRTEFVSAAIPPSSMDGPTLTWDFSGLAPLEKRKIEFFLHMPTAQFIGDSLTFKARIQDAANIISQTDNYRSLLRCSFDPNDKQVDPVGYGPDYLTLFEEEELEYLIRFQNTGNDTAFNIRITDELHPLLDISSFQVVSASHRYRAEIADRTLTFFFDDILLPDSTTNLEGSQGYVLFRINRLADLEEGAQITNQANIYFDRNEPIVTNEVINTFVSYICTELREEIQQTICAGETFEGYATSGTYVDQFTTINGCDSTRTLILTVLESSSATINREICAGGNIEGYTVSGTYIDTFTAANGCDSIRTLVLTVKDNISTTISREICAGGNVEGYDASGTYTDTFTAANGCDSTRTLVLTVNENISTTISREICAGGNVEGYDASGTYTDTFTAANGCDSTRTLLLTINNNISTTISREICAGENVEGYDTSGTYTDTFTAVNGCDSTRTLVLTVNDNISTTINREICIGGNVEGYDASGTYTDTFTAANGCDSTRTLVLIVNDNITTTINREICAGGNVEGYDASGTYTDTFTAANGCDSTRTLVLTVNDNISTTISREICAGGNVEGYAASGTYTDTFTAANGCDSTRTLVLTVNDNISTTISREICAGGNVEGYDASGTYTDTFTAANGCDSTRILVLTVNENISTTISREICVGGNVEGYDASGTYTDTFTAANGCDSTRTLVLIVNDNVSTTISREICAGGNVEGYNASGTYTDTFTAANGCDSTRILVLTVNDNISTTISREICAGGNVEGYDASGTYTDTFTAANGCDSTRILVLTVNENISTTISREICAGGNVEGYDASGTYTDTFTAANGCDSTRILVLTVNDNISTTISREICAGESLEGYDASGMYRDIFIAASGCDSIRTLQLTVLSPVSTTIEREICEGESLEGYAAPGTYTDTFIGSNGCDSIRTLVLSLTPVHQSTLDITVCDETLQGPPETTTEISTFIASNGCDSIVTVNYHRIPLETIAVDTAICAGDSLYGYGEAGLYVDTLYDSGTCRTIRTLQLNVLGAGDAQCLVPTLDPEAFGVRIFPNPVVQLLTVSFDEHLNERVQVRLLDLRGRVIMEEDHLTRSNLQLDLSALPGGMYLLELNRGRQSTVQKVIKME
ncbi:T9SS type A sorting domain-containing protein [Flavilitoribacter nigricans]|uniref:T9SS type A sorting domain-containing protein n=1 Tax=Flavilitoribacter nigricans TaxID=70997 RepID=UPI001472A91E|nr:T9SS type A sorting domain-containing protein [Flavilitoribacter nigricans]